MKDKKDIHVGVEMSAAGSSLKADVSGEQQAVSDFLSGIVPDFVKDGVGIFSDQVKLWRWKNQVNIILKAREKVQASGLDKMQVPLKVLSPIIQNSSLEEEENMQEKWVNMLANAVTQHVEVSPNYAAILNELSPLEVVILDNIFTKVNKESDYKKRRAIQFDATKIQEIYGLTEEKMDLIVENLFRLNLAQPPAGAGIQLGDHKFTLRTTKVFEFTTLGYEFVKACNWDV